MKVAYDHQVFTHQKFGGISRYFAKLAEGVEGYGAEPRIFAGFHQNSYLQVLPPRLVKGFHLPPSLPALYRLRAKANEVMMMARLRTWKPDIVHETFFRSGAFRFRNTPTVITIYDMIPELFPSEFPEAAQANAIKKAAAIDADHVICISHSTRADVLRLCDIDPGKVSVVYLGVDQPVSLQSEIPRKGGSRDKPYFLFVGQRGGYKNFGRLLKAFAASSLDAEFDLIAFGGGAFNALELEEQRSLGLRAGTVSQMGGDDAMLGELYAGAQGFVYPSVYEGFGLPPLEAMVQGCPVLSSNTSSMPEVIGNAGEFFDPESLDDIRRALRLIASDNGRRDSLIAAGRQRITSFTWENTARETVAVYDRLL